MCKSVKTVGISLRCLKQLGIGWWSKRQAPFSNKTLGHIGLVGAAIWAGFPRFLHGEHHPSNCPQPPGNVDDDKEIDEIYTLLTENYVEDDETWAEHGNCKQWLTKLQQAQKFNICPPWGRSHCEPC